jgi:hypothetical protein
MTTCAKDRVVLSDATPVVRVVASCGRKTAGGADVEERKRVAQSTIVEM